MWVYSLHHHIIIRPYLFLILYVLKSLQLMKVYGPKRSVFVWLFCYNKPTNLLNIAASCLFAPILSLGVHSPQLRDEKWVEVLEWGCIQAQERVWFQLLCVCALNILRTKSCNVDEMENGKYKNWHVMSMCATEAFSTTCAVHIGFPLLLKTQEKRKTGSMAI